MLLVLLGVRDRQPVTCDRAPSIAGSTVHDTFVCTDTVEVNFLLIEYKGETERESREVELCRDTVPVRLGCFPSFKLQTIHSTLK